jgi:hypothetical protein
VAVLESAPTASAARPRRGPDPTRGLRGADGSPLVGWTVASRRRRLAAFGLDAALFVVTLGVGWAVLAWRAWADGTSPGRRRLGLTVFATDTRRPADRRRMMLRGLVYQGLLVVAAICTLGLAWLYTVLGTAGRSRRMVHEEWAQVVVMAPPPPGPPQPEARF